TPRATAWPPTPSPRTGIAAPGTTAESGSCARPSRRTRGPWRRNAPGWCCGGGGGAEGAGRLRWSPPPRRADTTWVIPRGPAPAPARCPRNRDTTGHVRPLLASGQTLRTGPPLRPGRHARPLRAVQCRTVTIRARGAAGRHADAVPAPVGFGAVVGTTGQGRPHQRPQRDGRHAAHLPSRVPQEALPHPRGRVLRVGAVGHQAPALPLPPE